MSLESRKVDESEDDVFGTKGYEVESEKIETLRKALLDDGWEMVPTYPEHESVKSAATLAKQGFCVMLMNRAPGWIAKWGNPDSFECEVNAWGPDGLAVTMPSPYSWDALRNATLRCGYCKQIFHADQIVRIGFAGRCCKACRKKHVGEVERPGWDN